MNDLIISIGDKLQARGIYSVLEVVGFRSVEVFKNEQTQGVELRRVHPVTGELEGGEPLWLPLEDSGLQKLGSLAGLI